tara:strand:- start:378 stop:584 length:207 start_codon:yes stop_codon:yes gene_type:complete
MNKKALEGLMKEEEIMNEIKDSRFEIKDLERELDWMYSREPDEFKYIAHLEGRVRELYAKIEKLDEIN